MAQFRSSEEDQKYLKEFPVEHIWQPFMQQLDPEHKFGREYGLTQQDVDHLKNFSDGISFEIKLLAFKGETSKILIGKFTNCPLKQLIGKEVVLKIRYNVKREDWKNEYKIVSRITTAQNPSPNIMTFFGIFENPNMKQGYQVMEYTRVPNCYDIMISLDKTEIFNFIPFDELTARYLMNGIIAGVEWLHQNGIAHMELNLQHVLLFPSTNKIPTIKDSDFSEEIRSFTPKIVDFRYAVMGQPGQESLMVTADGQKWVSFVAGPEAYEEGKQIDAFKMDVYALGLMMFRLVRAKDLFFLALVDDNPDPIANKNLNNLYQMKTDENFFKSILDYYFGYQEEDGSLFELIWYSIQIDPEDRPNVTVLKNIPWLKKEN